MILKINIDRLNNIENKLDAAMTILANVVVTDVQQQLRENKSVVEGTLLKSIRVVDGVGLEKKIGTNIIYAPRVEFGFVGKDSLGRYYNQKPKSFLRVTLQKNKKKYYDFIKRMMKNVI